MEKKSFLIFGSLSKKRGGFVAVCTLTIEKKNDACRQEELGMSKKNLHVLFDLGREANNINNKQMSICVLLV